MEGDIIESALGEEASESDDVLSFSFAKKCCSNPVVQIISQLSFGGLCSYCIYLGRI